GGMSSGGMSGGGMQGGPGRMDENMMGMEAISSKRAATAKKYVTFSYYVHKKNKDLISVFEPIADTIPSFLISMLADLERDCGFQYNLDRFTLVDVPEQIFSYQRDWSTVQELMQPEIAFLPGAGSFTKLSNPNDVYKWNKESQDKGWSRTIVSDTTLRINAFKNISWGFSSKTNVADVSQAQMGEMKVSTVNSPYYLPAVVFNNDYNISSDEYTWGRRLIEQYVVNPEATENAWIRRVTGLSNEEQMLLMLEEETPEYYLTNTKYYNMTDVVIGIIGNMIFNEAEMIIGPAEFSDVIMEIIENYKHSNVSFEQIISNIEYMTQTDIKSKLPLTKEKLQQTAFYASDVIVSQYPDDFLPLYVYEFTIKNLSDVAGYAELTISDDEVMMVYLEANETKKFVKHLTYKTYRPQLNTLNSYNIPQIKSLTVVDNPKTPYIPISEGEFTVDDIEFWEEGEIIVDNEDKDLFQISDAPPTGYINAWIDQSMESEFKYKAVRTWRAPFRWTLVSDEKYYGIAISSAYIIKKGDGSQTATWKIPVTESGTYVFYFMATQDNTQMRSTMMRGGNNSQGGGQADQKYTYDFTIKNGDISASYPVNMASSGGQTRRAPTATWTLIGEREIDAAQELSVILSNKTDLQSVTADAIKVVKVN
ncbi:MAG: hypothetical protein R3Y04_08295, partial [Rikenellaceae bacterium]